MREDKSLQTPTPNRGDIENLDGAHVVPRTALGPAFTEATSPAMSLGLDPVDSSTTWHRTCPQPPAMLQSQSRVLEEQAEVGTDWIGNHV